MKFNRLYIIDPNPCTKQILEIANYLYDKYKLDLSELNKDVYYWNEVKQLILEQGQTKILSPIYIEEAILRDNIPKNQVLATLQSMLNACNPNTKLHIIDSYLYPKNHDPDYINYFINIFENAIIMCSNVNICTKTDRNIKLEQSIQNEIRKKIHKY